MTPPITQSGLLRYFVKSAASTPVWGTKEYLVAQYDDIDSATECRKDSKEWRAAERLVNAMSKKKTGAYVFKVLKTKGSYDERPASSAIAHIVVGLNGPGRAPDYLRELAKAVGTENRVLDAHIDALDDLWDFLIVLDKDFIKGEK